MTDYRCTNLSCGKKFLAPGDVKLEVCPACGVEAAPTIHASAPSQSAFPFSRHSLGSPPPVSILRQPEAKAIYLLRGPEPSGPYSLAQVRNLLKTGAIKNETLWAIDGSEKWKPVEGLGVSALNHEDKKRSNLLLVILLLVPILFIGTFIGFSRHAERLKLQKQYRLLAYDTVTNLIQCVESNLVRTTGYVSLLRGVSTFNDFSPEESRSLKEALFLAHEYSCFLNSFYANLDSNVDAYLLFLKNQNREVRRIMQDIPTTTPLDRWSINMICLTNELERLEVVSSNLHSKNYTFLQDEQILRDQASMPGRQRKVLQSLISSKKILEKHLTMQTF